MVGEWHGAGVRAFRSSGVQTFRSLDVQALGSAAREGGALSSENIGQT